jgi:predicted O-methyltransferase YrrM
MNIQIFESLLELKNFFNFAEDGTILETDLDKVINNTEVNGRQLRDAEVLTILTKNLGGNCLEIGTHIGKGTFKIATNTDGVVYTVNALPEQITGQLVTDVLTKEQIGSFLREMQISNFEQIYADSMNWRIPTYICDLSVVFVDGCHDAQYVYNDSKNVFGRIKKGGFIVWHDFSSKYRSYPEFSWINDCMLGVERFCTEANIDSIFHLENSYMGFYRV